ncbi:MAG: hypothetical protein DRN04_19460 [Thermoprotei archaeon]|nr:MAG: hypothetical protein DRN04_19460 [Thermoprotei archaeon]
MAEAVGTVAKEIAREVAIKAGENVLRSIFSHLIDKLRRRKVPAIFFLVYCFDSPVALEELASEIVSTLKSLGVDDRGFIGEDVRVSYDMTFLLDDVLSSIPDDPGYFELSEEEFEEYSNQVVKLVVSLDVLKWSRGTLKNAYSILHRIIDDIRGKYNGGYRAFLIVRGKIDKSLPVIYSTKKETVLEADPIKLGPDGVNKLVKLPPVI